MKCCLFAIAHLVYATAIYPFPNPELLNPSDLRPKLSNKKILLVGDSLTEYSYKLNDNGFGVLLSEKYVRRFDIINRGFSGYTTRQIYNIINDFAYSHQEFELSTLLLGTNDACLQGYTQYVPLEEYQKNLHLIAQEILKKSKKLIIITPPFVDDRFGPERKNINTIKYRNAAIQVATSLGLKYLDLWDLFHGSHVSDAKVIEKTDLKYLSDGLHFSNLGNEIIFHALVHFIESEYPELNIPNHWNRWWRMHMK